MRFEYSITIYCSWILICIAIKLFRASGREQDSLVIVHVLFRHGERTPNGPEELYPNDPYLNEKYFPTGLGQLTLSGKRKEYAIGKTLRSRYHEFLGSFYYPDIVDARSTDYNRTKVSLQLVLAGLFPPVKEEEMWNSALNWQPVPYNYYPRTKDEILIGVYCPNFLKLYKDHINSPIMQEKLNKDRHFFEYISRNSGLNVTTYHDIYNLYFGLSTEEEWGFVLPHWTKKIWPKVVIDLTIKEYYTATATPDLRKMACGYFLQKVINDSLAKIEGRDEGRKMYLYSGHENNIAELLLVLGIFDPPHVPSYGAYLIFEVHKVKDSYGIKIFYENYDGKKLQMLKLPNCDYVCEIRKFVSLVQELLPTPGLCRNEHNYAEVV